MKHQNIIFLLVLLMSLMGIQTFASRAYAPGVSMMMESNEAIDNLCPDDHHPHLIDLGLPSGTKWACCNVGASRPEDYGDYFAWGETTPKDEYNWSTYKWMNAGQSDWGQINKYTNADGQTSACWYSNGTFVGDGLTELLPEDDAATANWGRGWRMPTIEQYEELINSEYTTTEWTTQNGVSGRKITSKSNGNSLFLPAAGWRYDMYLYSAGWHSGYRSRSLHTRYSDLARHLYFSSDYVLMNDDYRAKGQSVRPVLNADTNGTEQSYPRYLVVWDNNDAKTTYALKDKPQVTLADDAFVVTKNGQETSFPMGSTKRFTYERIMPGDINGDAKVDIVDVAMTINYLLSVTRSDFPVEAADLNKNGGVDSDDVTAMIDLVVNGPEAVATAPVQQSRGNALYNYRNDGDFNAWLNIDVDSITYSRFDLDGIECDNVVTQEVWTPDSCFRIPIETIDSIGFRVPAPEFKEGIFHITDEHLPYTVDVDDLSVTFNSNIPTSMLPAVGQTVVSDVYEDAFEDGFAGRVESVDFLGGKYVIQCSEVKITDIFSKLVLVGKGVSFNDDPEGASRKAWSWWNDPIFTVEEQGVFPVKLPKELNLSLLADVCSVKSKNPELTVSYFLYLDDVIYSFSADAYLNHKDLTFQVAFKLSDFKKIGNTVSDYMTNFILGKGNEEEVEEKWYEHEFDDIKLKIPFQAGPVNFTFEVAPIFKLEGDVELDLINKTSARQHIGFKSSGYTASLLRAPFLPLTLGDLKYSYVQDPIKAQQLTLKAEGSATVGISVQLKANVISKKLLHAAVGAEYDRKASATLQFNLYDTENPISGLYDVIKDSKVKVEDYVKIKGEIGVSPLEILTLKGSFKIPVKTWGEYYMVPHFSKPELPPYENSPWNFSKPLSLYSAVSKDIMLGCKPGLRIETSDGRYVKQYTSTEEYQYEAAWVHTPLEIDISDLTPNETYRCYPTFSMLGLDPFVVTPYNEFTIPQNLSVSPQSISMPVGMEYIIEIRDGWDTFAVVMEKGEDVVSIVHDAETDARHIKIKGEKEGSASLKIEDRRSGQTVHVPITITYAMTLVTSITLSQTTLNLQEGGTQSLTATVLPEDADNRTVAWESSDEGVATVTADGLVRAVAKGTCVITCSATDGSGVKAVALVTVTSGTIPDPGNHEWVDLGLPSGTLWATCNVGASSPEDYGLYFAWGETQGYTGDTSDGRSFDWASYKWMNAGQSIWSQINKYTFADGQTDACWYSDDTFVGDGLRELLPEDDAATANWGSGWRMPTIAQIEELINSAYTSTEWTTQNGVNGRKITSKRNGNSIFLPAAGGRHGTSLDYAGSDGYYWSRSLDTYYSDGARYLRFGSGYISTYSYYRYCGQGVRPVRVQKKEEAHEYVDLGLPSGTLWATCNVGASSPEEYGDYFAWGETTPKDNYDWSTYIHCDGSYSTCHDIGSDIAGTEYDAATANWGAPWRMPSFDQVKELLNNTTSEWTTLNGVYGRKFTGSNGGTIFLPAAGRRKQSNLIDIGNVGYSWASMQVTSVDIDAAYIYLDDNQTLLSDIDRVFGLTVRPVSARNDGLLTGGQTPCEHSESADGSGCRGNHGVGSPDHF